MTVDRDEIAQRHGIPDLADQLRGSTQAEVDAFAAAIAALRQPEPPVNAAEVAALAMGRDKREHARRLLGAYAGEPAEDQGPEDETGLPPHFIPTGGPSPDQPEPDPNPLPWGVDGFGTPPPKEDGK